MELIGGPFRNPKQVLAGDTCELFGPWQLSPVLLASAATLMSATLPNGASVASALDEIPASKFFRTPGDFFMTRNSSGSFGDLQPAWPFTRQALVAKMLGDRHSHSRPGLYVETDEELVLCYIEKGAFPKGHGADSLIAAAVGDGVVHATNGGSIHVQLDESRGSPFTNLRSVLSCSCGGLLVVVRTPNNKKLYGPSQMKLLLQQRIVPKRQSMDNSFRAFLIDLLIENRFADVKMYDVAWTLAGDEKVPLERGHKKTYRFLRKNYASPRLRQLFKFYFVPYIAGIGGYAAEMFTYGWDDVK
jgi:hypothetical protein